MCNVWLALIIILINCITGKVNYFARKQWAAKPLSKNYSKLELPIKHVIIAHTEQLPCYTEVRMILLI